jgi:hypothetical protein
MEIKITPIGMRCVKRQLRATIARYHEICYSILSRNIDFDHSTFVHETPIKSKAIFQDKQYVYYER